MRIPPNSTATPLRTGWTSRLGAICIVLASANVTPAIAVELPEDAVLLTAVELLNIYGDKTWRWGEGGAYFDIDGRRMRARTVSENGETVTSGTWKITNSGKLCLIADWGTDELTETCFEHMGAKGDIYQRRLPDGDWYVFKHADTEPEDEYLQLVPKDQLNAEGTTN